MAASHCAAGRAKKVVAPINFNLPHHHVKSIESFDFNALIRLNLSEWVPLVQAALRMHSAT